MVVLASAWMGCGSAGPYGYARTYFPTEAEQRAEKATLEYDPVMAERDPEAWASQPVSLFGVVSLRTEEGDDTTSLVVSLRRLERRNLCESGAEDSCRVTVTEKVFGSVRVLVKLRPEDRAGSGRVDPGSLVRVIGLLTPKRDSEEAPTTIRATFYRHWPPDQYVTTAQRKYMRR
jgi:hypothetical protein